MTQPLCRPRVTASDAWTWKSNARHPFLCISINACTEQNKSLSHHVSSFLYQHSSLCSIVCERTLDTLARAGSLLLPFDETIESIFGLVVLSNSRPECHPPCKATRAALHQSRRSRTTVKPAKTKCAYSACVLLAPPPASELPRPVRQDRAPGGSALIMLLGVALLCPPVQWTPGPRKRRYSK